MNEPSERVGLLTWLSLLTSAGVVGGSLYLSLGLGLIACPLCFYQRTFAIAVLCILAVGVLGGVRPAWRLSLLALAPAFGGLGMAGWHYSLVASGAMVCPDGALGFGSAPLQSLAAFAVLTLLLCCDVAVGCRSTSDACGATTLGGVTAMVLGLGLAFASLKATHLVPLPSDFPDIEKICRKAPPKTT